MNLFPVRQGLILKICSFHIITNVTATIRGAGTCLWNPEHILRMTNSFWSCSQNCRIFLEGSQNTFQYIGFSRFHFCSKFIFFHCFTPLYLPKCRSIFSKSVTDIGIEPKRTTATKSDYTGTVTAEWWLTQSDHWHTVTNGSVKNIVNHSDCIMNTETFQDVPGAKLQAPHSNPVSALIVQNRSTIDHRGFTNI